VFVTSWPRLTRSTTTLLGWLRLNRPILSDAVLAVAGPLLIGKGIFVFDITFDAIPAPTGWRH
jgi:hypothetical protein